MVCVLSASVAQLSKLRTNWSSKLTVIPAACARRFGDTAALWSSQEKAAFAAGFHAIRTA